MKLFTNKVDYSAFNIRHSTLNRGFTLMELMIVIALIAILVTVGAGAYFASIKTGRDTQRKGDLKQIQKAFEQYFADSGDMYPSSCTVGPLYLPQGMPKDPNTGLVYAGTCTATTYCICASMESGNSGNSTTSDCTAFANSGSYFCVNNLQ